MKPITLIDSTQLDLIVNRLCYQLIENHDDFSNSVILGIQPRGIYLAELIRNRLEEILQTDAVNLGKLDVTFHRDDFRRRTDPIAPNTMDMDFLLENKNVILIDDVLYTGRTIRAALDAMLSFGRPKKVELLVLIDRRFTRQLPVEPNYVGKSIDAYDDQLVKVMIDQGKVKNKVLLLQSASGYE